MSRKFQFQDGTTASENEIFSNVFAKLSARPKLDPTQLAELKAKLAKDRADYLARKAKA